MHFRKGQLFRFLSRTGATNITGALRLLHKEAFTVENGDRPFARNIGILITDGDSTLEDSSLKEETMAVREVSIVLF